MKRSRVTCAALAASGCVALAASVGGPVRATTISAPASTGSVYFVQALPDTEVTVTIDGANEKSGVRAGSVIGPVDLSAGRHTLTASGSDPEFTLNARFRVQSDGSADVVLHRPAAVAGEPTVTVYRNPLAAVPRGTGRVRVAHTATVPPADVRVDGQVVLANIANGEFATAEVPAGPHEVAVVPTGQRRPALIGPVELRAASSMLTQVFAMGRPQNGSMDVIVQRLPLPTRGSAAPEQVNTGSAGLVAGVPVVGLRR